MEILSVAIAIHSAKENKKHGTQQHSNLTPISVRVSFHRTGFVNIFVFCLPDHYLLSMKGQ